MGKGEIARYEQFLPFPQCFQKTFTKYFSKREENTVGKGETARYEQFLHFPQCFQETFTADT